MRRLSHSLAPRTDSAAGGAAMSQESVLLPAMDSMEARNHASYSHLRDHCFDPAIPAGHPGAFEQRGAKPRRTISVGVEENQNASAGADTLSGEADVAFQYTVFDHFGAMDANRFQECGEDCRLQLPAQSVEAAPAPPALRRRLRQSPEWTPSSSPAKQVDTLRVCELRVRMELIDTEQFARREGSFP